MCDFYKRLRNQVLSTTGCKVDDTAISMILAWQAARAQQAGVPEGWKLVPCHATPEMISRGKRAHKEEFLYHEDANLNIQQVWKAMAAIAPNPPEQGAGQ